jgi:RND family efflux transporter MFP subunit
MKRIIFSILFLISTLSADKIYATFDVVAHKSASLAFSSGGIIDKIYVDVGSVVKKGEPLAKLDNNDIKALLNVHKTTLKFAKKDLDRQIKIRNLIDQAKYDSFENKYESAKAQVEYQQTLLDKTILKAPFDGVIISKELESGDVVSGQMIKTAFKIQSKAKRKLIIEFDQKYHGKVNVGDKFSYKVDGDEKSYKGTISKIYPYADTKTRKITAEVKVKNLVVGLFGDGYITKK